MSPWEGAKVITAEQDSIRGQPGACCSGMKELRKLAGCEAGVPTELVDLA